MNLDSGVGENMAHWATYLNSESSHRVDVTIKQGNTWQTGTTVPNTK